MSKAIRLARAPVWVACAGLSLSVACGAEITAAPCDPQALLRISEVMVRPASGRSADQWVEIVNRGEAEAGTDGLLLDVLTPTREAAHQVQEGTALKPGEHALLVRAAGALKGVHGGLLPSLNLPKRQARLRLRCGAAALDTWCYGSDGTPSPLVGHSLMESDRAGTASEPRWCVTRGPPYDGVNVGTPGLPNSVCARCTEGDGVWRDVRAPGAGDLLLKELAPRPASGAADAWVEVYGAGEESVDLNGLVITVTAARGTPKRYAYDGERCLTVPPGSSAGLGLGKAAARTGALPVTAVFEGPRVPKEPVQVALVEDDTDIAVLTIEAKRHRHRRGERAEQQTSEARCTDPCVDHDLDGES